MERLTRPTTNPVRTFSEYFVQIKALKFLIKRIFLNKYAKISGFST